MKRHVLRSLRDLSAVFVVLGVLGMVTLDAQQPARRMVVLLFDVGALQPDDLLRAAESSVKYVDETMTDTDMVSVVTIAPRLNVLTDFTSDRTQLKAALGSLTGGAAAGDAGNDGRLRSLRTLCETLAPIRQKKAVLYFSSGMRVSDDDGAALRDMTNTCNRANVSLYPVDARGLVAAVAGKPL